MNYEKIAHEIDHALWETKEPSQSIKIIKRACLEAQLEVIREIHKRKNIHYSGVNDLGTAYYQSASSINEEIEAKLKAMK